MHRNGRSENRVSASEFNAPKPKNDEKAIRPHK
ncbi:MAG: hypothetical protein ACJARN_002406, partial [Arenicella sp.]